MAIDVYPYWARRTLDVKAVLHFWDKPWQGFWKWISACGMETGTPMYAGPWPPDSGDKCEQCETLSAQKAD